MSATGSLGATVEALCGDLSAIRAPRGTELNARSWATEAPLRMLLNNLDADVAELPEQLIVYGGSAGRPQPRGLEGDCDVTAATRRRRDPPGAERQARGNLHDTRRRSASADRELSARAALGDVGRVSQARSTRPDDVRADDCRLVDLHRHPRHLAGHISDLFGS